MDKTNKVAIYVRVSTTNQAEEGYSIDEQKDKLTSYCDIKDWNVYQVYTDGGFSGSNTKRPALEQLITDAKRKRFDTVLVYKLDRLSRSQKDTLYLIEDVFIANDIAFLSLQENFDTSTPFGKAMIGLLSVFAQLEREQIKERMQLGKLGRAKAGKAMSWTIPPYGYSYNKNSGLLEIIPSQAVAVKRIFDEYIAGKPASKIARDIAKDYISPTGRKHWEINSIKHIVKNPTYYGAVTYHGKTYEGNHDPVIPKETFDLAQIEVQKRIEDTIKRTNNPRPFRAKYMLSGKLQCGWCGSTLRVWIGRKRKDGTTLKKYRCMNKECTIPYISFEELESAVINELIRFKTEEQLLNFQKPETKPIDKAAIKKEIKQLSQKLEKLNDLYLNDMITMEKLKEESSRLMTTKNRLENELDTNHDELIEKRKLQIKNILQETDLEKISYEKCKDLVNLLIDKIEVKPNDLKLFFRF